MYNIYICLCGACVRGIQVKTLYKQEKLVNAIKVKLGTNESHETISNFLLNLYYS